MHYREQSCPSRISVRPLSLTFHILTSPLQNNRLWRHLRGSKYATSSTKFLFSIRPENKDGRSGLWLTETFLISPPQTLNRIWQNVTGSKYTTSSIKFVSGLINGAGLSSTKVTRGTQVQGTKPFGMGGGGHQVPYSHKYRPKASVNQYQKRLSWYKVDRNQNNITVALDN